MTHKSPLTIGRGRSSSFYRLAVLMKPYSKKLLVCMLCVLIVNLADLLKPFVAEIIIDRFFMEGRPEEGLFSITGMSLCYFVVALLGALFSMTQVRLTARMSQTILSEMRHKVFDRILHLNMRALDRYGTGRLITRATNDVETINEFYSDVFLNLFKDIFLLLGIVAAMLLMDAKLALIAFAGVPLIFLLTFLLKSVIKRNFKRIKEFTGRINGFFSENISGMRLVQSFNREKEKHEDFKKLNQGYFKATMTQVLLNSFLRPVMEVINSLIIALLIAYGYDRISGGMLEVGVLYAFTNYVKQFFNPINDLAEKYTTIQSALVSTERIYEILDEKEVEDLEEGSHSGPVEGSVEFRDVWFAYEGEHWILRGISFRVEKGQSIAFVGHTGVGKSTIINLISRYYTAQKGSILVDGVRVEDWRLRDLRQGVSTVMQDVFLFTGDIGHNIDMHANLSPKEIERALEVSSAKEFVGEIGGLSGKVMEQGLNFSTGERQLLSFARAVAHEPAVLVLDEATAHIDTSTEEQVSRSIRSISRGRTSILIAHRLSTVRDCDVIFVLDKGEIAEQGSHEQLMKMKGIYASMMEAQEEKA